MSIPDECISCKYLEDEMCSCMTIYNMRTKKLGVFPMDRSNDCPYATSADEQGDLTPAYIYKKCIYAMLLNMEDIDKLKKIYTLIINL